MQPGQLLEVLSVAARLKTNTRHCYTDTERKESVADHSWRISLMAMLLKEEFPDTDMSRVIEMCLIHDLGGAFTGDIPTFNKNSLDEAKEETIYREWVNGFPEAEREHWNGLLDEMIALESKEAKLYKALDKLEAIISHNESDIATWLPLEYNLQYTYGKEQIAFSPYLKELRKLVDEWTTDKIKDNK